MATDWAHKLAADKGSIRRVTRVRATVAQENSRSAAPICEPAYCYTHTASLVPPPGLWALSSMTCTCHHRRPLRTVLLHQHCLPPTLPVCADTNMFHRADIRFTSSCKYFHRFNKKVVFHGAPFIVARPVSVVRSVLCIGHLQSPQVPQRMASLPQGIGRVSTIVSNHWCRSLSGSLQQSRPQPRNSGLPRSTT